MQNLKYLFLISISLLLFASCGDDNDTGLDPIGSDTTLTGYYFGVKSGTIIYSITDVYNEVRQQTLIFDDYGKKVRIEELESIQICDEDAGKAYLLDTVSKTYMNLSSTVVPAIRVSFIYLGDDYGTNWTYYPNFSKEKNRTIAGKSCSVCKWGIGDVTTEWGGWKRITFIYTEDQGGSIWKKEAISYDESVPDNSFKIPNGYESL